MHFRAACRGAALFGLCMFLLRADSVSPKLFNALEWRFIGPYRGGRVIAVTGIPGDGTTFYFGAVGGGVWKTTDAGTMWTPVFDQQNIASIGAIEVARSDRNVIYAGSGEADMRSDISVGNGIYKSTDGGKTWTNAGLHASQQIGRIAVDPNDANVVYVAALGHAYAPNAERGVFRSRDGGATWTKVLYKGPDTGAIDVAIVPEDSRVVYAALWNSHRPPWSQYAPIEGPGSGLYKTTDGGDHWQPLTGNGLPEGQWGKCGVAVARGTRGQRVYALIEAKTAGGLFRSDDGGKTWARAGTDPRITSRNWYFGEVTVDPKNPDIVYVPNVATYRSKDGGKTFEVLKGAPGGDDYHQLWIDPTNPARMILGSDQGVNISVDTGATWATWYNQPTAQMYHVVTDNQFPYWVYGSQQDSGTVALPSRTNHQQINEYDRDTVGGAESGYIAPDPKNPNIVYVGNTNGSLARWDKRTAQSQNITPWPEPGFGMEISERKYRHTWTSPLIFSPADSQALYFGSQKLLKTVDGGLNWKEVSPDLTGETPEGRALKGAVSNGNAKQRGYGVIYSIAPSPLDARLIWTGSDTGLIHVSRDGCGTWSDVTPHGLSDWSKITQLDASHFDAATAYAAVDRHRLDDYSPHLFRTHDFGKTWTEIDNGIAAPAFANAIREDPERKGLLYAATEMGVYVSFDDGDRWEALQLNLPVTSVRDLTVHGDDLVIATHGRGFWILDDITSLRQVDAASGASGAYLFKPAKAIRISSDSFQGTPYPPEMPRGKNPPDGAVIDYYLPSDAAGEVVLEIVDGQGQVIRRYSTNDAPRARRGGSAVADVWIVPPPHLTSKAGLNRFVWDLHYAPPQSAGGRRGGGGGGFGEAAGPFVTPGTYQVRLTASGRTVTQPLEVVLDPRSDATAEDLSAALELGQKASRRMTEAAQLARQLQAAGKADAAQQVEKDSRDLGVVLSVVNSADRRPPQQAYEMFEIASKDLDGISK